MGNSSAKRDKTVEIDDKTRQLVLLGLSGHGKSSTGNTILGMKANSREFKQGGGWESITKDSYVGSTMIGDLRCDITDMPGYNDNVVKLSRDRKDMVTSALAKSLMTCPYGFHAILFVVSYTKRLSDDDILCIQDIVALIGEEAFTRKGILVVTNGADFEDEEDNNGSFMDYIRKEQRSEMHGKIFQLFDSRCVLFENKHASADKKSEQLRTLIREVNALGLQRYIPKVCRYKGLRIQTFLDEHNQIIKIQIICTHLRLTRNLIITKDKNEWSDTLEENILLARVLQREIRGPKYVRWIEDIDICVKSLEEINKLRNNPNETFKAQCKNIHEAQVRICKSLEDTFYFEAIKINILQQIVNSVSKYFGGNDVY